MSIGSPAPSHSGQSSLPNHMYPHSRQHLRNSLITFDILQSIVIPGPPAAFQAEVSGTDFTSHLRKTLQARGARVPKCLQHFFFCATVLTSKLIQRHRKSIVEAYRLGLSVVWLKIIRVDRNVVACVLRPKRHHKLLYHILKV